MTVKGLVSVIMASYNHAQWVEEAMQSVISQTYKNIEFIIVDDCSQDNSLEKIKQYAKKYDFIKVFNNDKNEGISYTCSKLFQHVQGEFFAGLGSDDMWYKNKLKTQVNFLHNNPHIDAVFSLIDIIDKNSEIVVGSPLEKLVEQENKSNFQWIRYFIDNGNALGHSSVLLRSSVLKEIGGWDVYPLIQLQDFEYWYRMCVEEYNIHVLPEKLLAYRVHGKNISMSGLTSSIVASTELIYILNDLKKIKSVDTLIKIFPEHESMMRIHNSLLIPFYLAKIISEDNTPYKKIWGVLELYNCFANPKIAHLITSNNLMSLHEFSDLVIQKDICNVRRHLESQKHNK